MSPTELLIGYAPGPGPPASEPSVRSFRTAMPNEPWCTSGASPLVQYAESTGRARLMTTEGFPEGGAASVSGGAGFRKVEQRVCLEERP